MRFLLLTVMMGCFVSANAQTKSDIITDRPDQTEAPALVPRGGLQIETGFIYEKDNQDNVDVTNYTYNTTLIKYGVNDNLELRFITEYLGEQAKVDETSISKVEGFSPIALGVKLRIAEEKGIWPQAAMIGHINLETGSSEFAPEYTAADFRFTFAHSLSDKFSLSYNLGAEWNGETPGATFLYTLSLGYVITDKLGVFVETYSFFPEENDNDHRLDGGLTFKITPVVQVDLSGGIGLSSSAPDAFVSTGISARLFK